MVVFYYLAQINISLTTNSFKTMTLSEGYRQVGAILSNTHLHSHPHYLDYPYLSCPDLDEDTIDDNNSNS